VEVCRHIAWERWDHQKVERTCCAKPRKMEAEDEMQNVVGDNEAVENAEFVHSFHPHWG